MENNYSNSNYSDNSYKRTSHSGSDYGGNNYESKNYSNSNYSSGNYNSNNYNSNYNNTYQSEAAAAQNAHVDESKVKNPHYHPVRPNDKIVGILSYPGFIFWLVAFILDTAGGSDKRSPYATFHLNQGLVLWLFSLLGFIPVIGWIWLIILFVLAVIGFIRACMGKTIRLPIVGGIILLR